MIVCEEKSHFLSSYTSSCHVVVCYIISSVNIFSMTRLSCSISIKNHLNSSNSLTRSCSFNNSINSSNHTNNTQQHGTSPYSLTSLQVSCAASQANLPHMNMMKRLYCSCAQSSRRHRMVVFPHQYLRLYEMSEVVWLKLQVEANTAVVLKLLKSTGWCFSVAF